MNCIFIPSGPRNAPVSEDWAYASIGFTLKSLGYFGAGIGWDNTVRNTAHDYNSVLMRQLNWSFTIDFRRGHKAPGSAAPRQL